MGIRTDHYVNANNYKMNVVRSTNNKRTSPERNRTLNLSNDKESLKEKEIRQQRQLQEASQQLRNSTSRSLSPSTGKLSAENFYKNFKPTKSQGGLPRKAEMMKVKNERIRHINRLRQAQNSLSPSPGNSQSPSGNSASSSGFLRGGSPTDDGSDQSWNRRTGTNRKRNKNQKNYAIASGGIGTNTSSNNTTNNGSNNNPSDNISGFEQTSVISNDGHQLSVDDCRAPDASNATMGMNRGPQDLFPNSQASGEEGGFQRFGNVSDDHSNFENFIDSNQMLFQEDLDSEGNMVEPTLPSVDENTAQMFENEDVRSCNGNKLVTLKD